MRQNRSAVASFFLVNGFLIGNWTSRIPAVKAYFDISNSMLGIYLLCITAGAILAMPFSAKLITTFGSKNLTRYAGTMMCLFLPIMISMPNIEIAMALSFCFGLMGGSMDVAMNGQAVYVERDYRRPIMSSFHAVFSAGMAVGAGLGALFAKYDFSLFQHFGIVSVISVVVSVTAGFYLIDALVLEQKEAGDTSTFLLPDKAIWPLGIIAFCSMVGEGTMADWSALYMQSVVGQSEYYGGLTIGSFGVAMFIGRLVGDRFTERWGRYRMLRNSSLLAITGMAVLLGILNPATVLLGSFLLGLGLSSIAPIIYSAAGNIPGIAPSKGIAMAVSIGYTGFFIGPPILGFFADWFGLRIALLFTLFLLVIMIALVIFFQQKIQKI